MAKTSTRRVIKIRATTLATFQGTFAALIGLGIAILYSLEATIQATEATQSVLRGMAFGLATGVISMIVLPFIYFAFGWLIGLFQGWVYNAVLGTGGGVVFDLQDE
jgi:hypothetical protein